VTRKLLLSILSSLESVKQTQKLQMTTLQHDGETMPESTELPEDMSFPMKNDEELNSIEECLADAATKKALVCLLYSHVVCKIIGFVSI